MALGHYLRQGTSYTLNTSGARGSTSRRGYRFFQHVCSVRSVVTTLNDLPQGEGEALLKFLFDHTEKADFQCRFRWSPNAVAIWDNHGILHKATFDYWPQVRTGVSPEFVVQFQRCGGW